MKTNKIKGLLFRSPLYMQGKIFREPGGAKFFIIIKIWNIMGKSFWMIEV